MNLTQDQHRRWVSSFFNSKVKEFDFYLRSVIDCCDQSMQRFLSGQQGDEQTESKIVYAFSAFSNTVQTLKDAGSTFLNPTITWKDIEDLRHGKFIWLSRNAATHDGNPVISAWSDGRYFVPNDIHRFGRAGDLIEIPAPAVDAARFCLEFAQDFSAFLAIRLSSLGPVEGPKPNIAEIQQFLHSPVVPDFVRQLFDKQKVEIERVLAQVKTDPVGDAIASLRAIETFCEARLKA
ncbi:hypothetical protein BTH42_33925 [Burkholderia sp. SRS-W-2-2016]|uniref:hypothetical protein n=1 Tax=Burkholderia sp. SRS-W-2-2016 TaxID=1926878 RepID=UPI00094AA980|nr:hypothetical protein [Burkholderia sp. SRS-W-2-2016]OLL27229.1 hypothetical protein BTH42_33925 [Burkholderia sp. SRS-W-2-2016]